MYLLKRFDLWASIWSWKSRIDSGFGYQKNFHISVKTTKSRESINPFRVEEEINERLIRFIEVTNTDSRL